MQEFIIGFCLGVVLSLLIVFILYRFFAKLQKSEFEQLTKISLEQHTSQSRQNLELMLSPFKERLADYQKSIEAYNLKGSENAAALKNEMEHVLSATQKIEMEAANLTKALRGDVKAQGNWGEMILENILTLSGFESGREYVAQGVGQNHRGEKGNLLRPDVVINYPDGGNLVVDSKVSLVAYEKYVTTDDENLREVYLKELRQSVKKHIDDLSSKKYEMLETVKSPDYVLLFIPIESVFALLVKYDNDLLNYAWKKRVHMVTPTSLMAVLKTVQSLWRIENQNTNAQEIAKKAGLLYDKFFVFYQELEGIESDFQKTSERFQKSFSRLKDGKGNLLGRVEELKEMGALTSK